MGPVESRPRGFHDAHPDRKQTTVAIRRRLTAEREFIRPPFLRAAARGRIFSWRAGQRPEEGTRSQIKCSPTLRKPTASALEQASSTGVLRCTAGAIAWRNRFIVERVGTKESAISIRTGASAFGSDSSSRCRASACAAPNSSSSHRVIVSTGLSCGKILPVPDFLLPVAAGGTGFAKEPDAAVFAVLDQVADKAGVKISQPGEGKLPGRGH